MLCGEDVVTLDRAGGAAGVGAGAGADLVTPPIDGLETGARVAGLGTGLGAGAVRTVDCGLLVIVVDPDDRVEREGAGVGLTVEPEERVDVEGTGVVTRVRGAIVLGAGVPDRMLRLCDDDDDVVVDGTGRVRAIAVADVPVVPDGSRRPPITGS